MTHIFMHSLALDWTQVGLVEESKGGIPEEGSLRPDLRGKAFRTRWEGLDSPEILRNPYGGPMHLMRSHRLHDTK